MEKSGCQVDRPSSPGLHVHPSQPDRLSDAQESELLVELRLAGRRRPGDHDRHRTVSGDALQSQCRSCLRFGRADHAGRELRLADAVHACQRRLHVLPVGLHPHVPGAVLRLIPGAPRGAVVHRPVPLPRHDGDGLRRLHPALGPDELLGRHGDHQPVLGGPVLRRRHRAVVAGRLRGRQSDIEPFSTPFTSCCPS